MDVRSAILKCYTQTEVFVDQPLDFINPTFPNHVFKFKNGYIQSKTSS